MRRASFALMYWPMSKPRASPAICLMSDASKRVSGRCPLLPASRFFPRARYIVADRGNLPQSGNHYSSLTHKICSSDNRVAAARCAVSMRNDPCAESLRTEAGKGYRRVSALFCIDVVDGFLHGGDFFGFFVGVCAASSKAITSSTMSRSRQRGRLGKRIRFSLRRRQRQAARQRFLYFCSTFDMF